VVKKLKSRAGYLNLMRRSIARGGMHGLFFLIAVYGVVYFRGYGRNSLIAIMYIIILMAIWMEIKDSIEVPELDFLKRIVIVSEEEKIRMTKVFTGEKYEVTGNIRKID